ncbi:MAG: Arc family DNA-binding protein [Leptospirales bacterium]
MKKKYVPVRLPEEVLERVKKIALAQGKSVSEEIGILVRNSLESDHGPDQVEAFKKAIRELRNEGKGEEDYRAVLADLGLESLNTPSGSASGIDPKVIRFLTEKVSLTSALLIGVSSKMAGTYVADHNDRIDKARAVVGGEMKTLFKGA